VVSLPLVACFEQVRASNRRAPLPPTEHEIDKAGILSKRSSAIRKLLTLTLEASRSYTAPAMTRNSDQNDINI